MLNRLVVFVFASLLLAACGNDKQPPVNTEDSTSATTGTGEVEELPPDAICTPGTVKECTPDKTSEVVCADDGMAWTARQCRDDRAQKTVCDEGACLNCTPLDKRCRDDDQVEMCQEDGTGWVDDAHCNGTFTGQVCNIGACVKLCDVNVKYNSYMGCEYWGADLDNGFVPGPNGGALDAAGAQYALIVSNPSPKYPAEVEIWDSTGKVTHDATGMPFPDGRIMPRELRVYKMPRRDVNGTLLQPLAYKVTTSVPTIVYQFNPLTNEDVFSNDASLLLPQHSLDRWYYVMTRMQTFEGIRAYMTVLGTQVDTEVTITVSAHTLAGDDIPALAPGDTITRTLGPFDVLNLETNGLGEDLTGSVVFSSRKVAVFGGSEGANVPNSDKCIVGPGEEGVCEQDGQTECTSNADCSDFITCCADHIEQQLFPVASWGREYACARTIPRGNELESWRVLAGADNTVVTTIPQQANIPVLHAGEWFEFQAAGDFELSASKPVLLGQFMQAEQAPTPGNQSGDAGIGDPAFMLVPPAEQFRSDYVVLNPPEYEQDFINVIKPMEVEISLDGAVIDESLFEPIGTGVQWVARIAVEDGVHVLESSNEDDTFGVLVYGYDQYVSYGYPGGLDLKKFDILKPPDAFGDTP